jgi:penicillin amidase
LRRGLAGLGALLAGLLLSAGSVLWLGQSRPGGTYELRGLIQPVEIRFDDRWRPWVRASSLQDALFAEGWLHARYRLWQMELLRRAGRGHLAEALGAGLLESDRALWRAGVPQLAQRLEAQASDRLLQAVDAYVDGVNAAQSEMGARPPEFWLTGLEPTPWTRGDAFAVGAVIAFQSAMNLDNELLRLALAGTLDARRMALFLPDETQIDDFPYVIPHAGEDSGVDLGWLDALDTLAQVLLPSASLGSSGWAVAPERTAGGYALFAFDSHDDLTLPDLFYELHLFYGPSQSLRGWSLPGLPGIINGFNEHLAWGLTNIGDTQDLFLETRHPQHRDWFEMDGEWYTARRDIVSIPVRGKATPERLTILHTRNGPLISEQPPLSLRWTGHDLGGRGMDSLLTMNTAASLEEFEAALDQHGAPSANVTYADRDGHVMFRTIGLIPRRGAGRGLVPLAGNLSKNQWQGMVATKELPRLLDPAIGYVAAANARVHAGPPLVSADNAAGYRMRRLHAVLGARNDFTLDDMQRLQLDFFNSQAARLLPHLLPALAGLNKEPEAAVAALLREWAKAPRNDPDSAGALIWEHWYPALARKLFGDQLGEPLLNRLMSRNYVLDHALDRLIEQEPQSPWWRGRRSALLQETFREVVAELIAKAGPEPTAWRWDAVQTVYFKHELDGAAPLLGRWLSRGPLPWGGGNPVLGRARYRYDRPFIARAGATVRVVAEMTPLSIGTTLQVRAIIPGGQHGHPANAHYDDQLESWLNGELDLLHASPELVDGPATRLQPMRP